MTFGKGRVRLAYKRQVAPYHMRISRSSRKDIGYFSHLIRQRVKGVQEFRREIIQSYLVQFDAVALCRGAVIHVSQAYCPITMPA